MDRTLHSPEHARLCGLLKELRQRADLTQAELAERLAVSQGLVSKLEAGEVRVDLLQLRQMLQALDVDVVAFVRAFERGDTTATRIHRRRSQ